MEIVIWVICLTRENISKWSGRAAVGNSRKKLYIEELVSRNQSSQNNSNVIPGKQAKASATRNPGILKPSGYRPTPE